MITSILRFTDWRPAEIRAFAPILVSAAIKNPGAFVRSKLGDKHDPHFPVDDPELIPDFFMEAGFSMDDSLAIAAAVSGRMPTDVREYGNPRKRVPRAGYSHPARRSG